MDNKRMQLIWIILIGMLISGCTLADVLGIEADINSDLVVHIPMLGNTEDISGNDLHAVATSDPLLVVNRFGRPQSAVALTGQEGSYLTIPYHPALNLQRQATLSLWFRYETQANDGYYTLMEKTGDDEGHTRYGLWTLGERVVMCIEPANNAPRVGPQVCLESDAILENGIWHHVVGTYDGREMQLWLDGQLVGELTAQYRSGISTNDYPIYIGTDINAFNVAYTRMMFDDIRIYHRALTPSEVMILWQLER